MKNFSHPQMILQDFATLLACIRCIAWFIFNETGYRVKSSSVFKSVTNCV